MSTLPPSTILSPIRHAVRFFVPDGIDRSGYVDDAEDRLRHWGETRDLHLIGFDLQELGKPEPPNNGTHYGLSATFREIEKEGSR